MKIEYIKISELMARDLGANAVPPVLVVERNGDCHSLTKAGLQRLGKAKETQARAVFVSLFKTTDATHIVASPSGSVARFRRAIEQAAGAERM